LRTMFTMNTYINNSRIFKCIVVAGDVCLLVR